MNIGKIGKQFDLAIVESYDGGDLVFSNSDLEVVNGNENQPYLAMFGGNADKSKWWGDKLVFPNEPKRQLNSLTEYTLNNTPLTSAGRRSIEAAIAKDLAYLKPKFLQVAIVSDNKVECLLRGDFGEKVLRFSRRDNTGDFFLVDFNDDFF